MRFYKAKFALDSIDSTYDGFTTGALWNGFATPYFEKAEAERVLTDSEANGYHWRFDEAQDVYLVTHNTDLADYKPEKFGCFIIEVDGQLTKIYGIGAYYWVWEEVKG